MKKLFVMETIAGRYKVIRLVNSTRFTIGNIVTKDCLTALCSDAAWTITITGSK